MGDLIQALPSLTDAATTFPNIKFDWVVDEAFADIPLWHPNVHRVIKTANRRWRKHPLSTCHGGNLSNFYRDLNGSNYDVIIDLQNNLKSALVSLLRKVIFMVLIEIIVGKDFPIGPINIDMKFN